MNIRPLQDRILVQPIKDKEVRKSGIIIPADVTTVTVRAHDIVDGFGGQEVEVDLTMSSGENFEVDKN